MANWSHHSQNEWGEQFPISVQGKRQSPIDICAKDVTKESHSPFELKIIEGDVAAKWTLTNNGHTIVVKPPPEVKWQLSGGVLQGTYELDHFHSHWGNVAGHGSEHTLDGLRLDGETHFVFKLTPDKEEVEDKFVAYGIMMKEAAATNPKASAIIDTVGEHLGKIGKNGASTQIPGLDLNIIAEAHKGKDYFAYKGSLTTPPFAEVVLHVVFVEPLEISSKVFDQLRNLGDTTGGKTTCNYRAIQPLNGRKIFSCAS